MERRAKIVATVGPSTSSEKALARLFQAGVDVVRLNLSHGSREEHRELMRRVRAVADRQERYVGVIVDLMGPRYRLGDLAQEVRLGKGDEVVLGPGPAADLPLNDGDILRHLRHGERLLIDGGLVALEVLSKSRGRLRARVISGGVVSSRKGINLPDSKLPFRISEKDRLDLRMAVEHGADYVAASYVGQRRDVKAVQEMISSLGADIPVIAKLERASAVDHFEEIIDQAEAVMVARGDLGVEIPLHEVPVVQKRIVRAGWRLGKPVVVATQMLESMMHHPRPTRAETSDVANAVFDGADAMMLSGETAVGNYPFAVVETMHRIIHEAERHLLEAESGATLALGRGSSGAYDVEPPAQAGSLAVADTISAAATLSARQIGARRIVTLTGNGRTARTLSRRRPSTPVVALTENRSTARRLQLVWGVRPLATHGEVEHHHEVVELVDRRLLEAKLARPGDKVAILMGDPIQARPPTNLLRLHEVRGKAAAQGRKVGKVSKPKSSR